MSGIVTHDIEENAGGWYGV